MRSLVMAVAGFVLLVGVTSALADGNKRSATVTGRNGKTIEVEELWWGGVAQPASYSREAGAKNWDLDKENKSGQQLEIPIAELGYPFDWRYYYPWWLAGFGPRTCWTI